jgi:hypothetical protein
MGVLLQFINLSSAADNEVGTYALFKIKDGKDEDALYKINTKTGKVWRYSERAIHKAEDVGLTGKEAEGLNNLINQAKKQKKNVYVAPYWWPTFEEPYVNAFFTR